MVVGIRKVQQTVILEREFVREQERRVRSFDDCPLFIEEQQPVRYGIGRYVSPLFSSTYR
jgi:hypothetical protein